MAPSLGKKDDLIPMTVQLLLVPMVQKEEASSVLTFCHVRVARLRRLLVGVRCRGLAEGLWVLDLSRRWKP